MGNAQGGPGGPPGGKKDDKKDGDKKKWKSKGGPSRVGKKKRKKGPAPIARLPKIYPAARCKLRLSKLTRVKDFLLLEEEFMKNQEVLKPKKEKDQKELEAVEEVRGTPLAIGTLEEMIDDNHCIVSTSNGPEYYVNITSFVDKDQLEPGCTVLLHNKVCIIICSFRSIFSFQTTFQTTFQTKLFFFVCLVFFLSFSFFSSSNTSFSFSFSFLHYRRDIR
jgi:26S proteasome regulatory subunit T2